MLKCIAAVAVRLTVTSAVWFWRSGWPQAAAKVVDNLKPHIHPPAIDLKRVTAVAVAQIRSLTNKASDVSDRPTINNKNIHPSPIAHPVDVSQICVDSHSRLKDLQQVSLRLSGFGLCELCHGW